MLFKFRYEEILSRNVIIEGDTLAEALKIIENQIDKEEIVLDSSDFLCGQISMSVEDNPYVIRVEKDGEPLKNAAGVNVILEEW